MGFWRVGRKGTNMEKLRDKRIKRANCVSAGGLSGHLSGPVLQLTSTVCPVFSLNSFPEWEGHSLLWVHARVFRAPATSNWCECRPATEHVYTRKYQAGLAGK